MDFIVAQVDELDRATGVAERDPARFSVDVAEIERRKKWTASTLSQVSFLDLLYQILVMYFGLLGLVEQRLT